MARNLIVPRSARSDVWQHFGFEASENGDITDKRHVWCRLCDTKLLFSGNTSNLSAHIPKCPSRNSTPVKMDPIDIKNVSREATSLPVKMELTENLVPREATPVKMESVDVEEEISDFWTAEAMLGDGDKMDSTETGAQEEDMLKTGDEDNGDDGGDEGSHFCLQWKHHQNNQRHMFSLLLNQEAFCDVTLACEGQLIEAHKLVLASCSPYFETVLMRHYEKHPIIILKDVKYEDMKVLLQFMYKGEVNIEQDQLPSLLETAEGLKIRGLSEFGDEQLAQQQAVERTSVTPVPVSTMRSEVSSPRGAYKRRRVNDSPYTDKFTPGSSRAENHVTSAAPPTNRGSKFWRQPSVIRVLEDIRDGNLKMDEGAKLLNVSYANMYQHFRCRYGKIKDTPAWLAQNEAARRLAENNEAVADDDTVSSGGADSGGGHHTGPMGLQKQHPSAMQHLHLPPQQQQQQQQQQQPMSALAGLRG